MVRASATYTALSAHSPYPLLQMHLSCSSQTTMSRCRLRQSSSSPAVAPAGNTESRHFMALRRQDAVLPSSSEQQPATARCERCVVQQSRSIVHSLHPSSLHDPSSSDVSKTAIGTLAREGVRPAPGCKASPPQALGPPRVLKGSSKSPKIARARRPAGRYSWPPERCAPPARSAAAVGLKYGHD